MDVELNSIKLFWKSEICWCILVRNVFLFVDWLWGWLVYQLMDQFGLFVYFFCLSGLLVVSVCRGVCREICLSS